MTAALVMEICYSRFSLVCVDTCVTIVDILKWSFSNEKQATGGIENSENRILHQTALECFYVILNGFMCASSAQQTELTVSGGNISNPETDVMVTIE